jgi:hypothetical protein
MGDTRDYLQWHDAYDQPGSSLHRRLQIVIRLIHRALDELPPGPVRVVSFCAGQGADILGAAEGHPRAHDLTGRLVELDARNVEVARRRIDELALGGPRGLEVVEGDAGMSDAYAEAAPADLVLACGVFGNISEDDIERTIRFLPSLCAPGAWVLWTRHPREPGVLGRLQGWLEGSGLKAIELEIADDATYGVGANRLVIEPPPSAASGRLFTFVR